MFGIKQDGAYRVERIGFSTPTLTDGYVVAIRPLKREADIVTEGALFGRWTDDDGTVYWDEVEVIADRWDAVLTADGRNERAIWDLSAGAAIAIDRVTVSEAWEAMMVNDDPTDAPYLLRIMTVDGIEEETAGYSDEINAWDAYAAAASWGAGWYRTLTNDQGTILAEGVTA